MTENLIGYICKYCGGNVPVSSPPSRDSLGEHYEVCSKREIRSTFREIDKSKSEIKNFILIKK